MKRKDFNRKANPGLGAQIAAESSQNYDPGGGSRMIRRSELPDFEPSAYESPGRVDPNNASPNPSPGRVDPNNASPNPSPGRVNPNGSATPGGGSGNEMVENPDFQDTLSEDSGTLLIDPGQARENPRDAQGRLISAKQELFEDRFKPLEDEALDITLRDDFADVQGDRAAWRSNKMFDRSRQQARRQLARRGQHPGKGLRAAMDREWMMDKTSSAAQNANDMRPAIEDMQATWAQQIGRIGRGLSQSASGGLGSAASMAAQRKRIGEQNDAAQKQSQISTAATAGGLSMAAGMSNPVTAGLMMGGYVLPKLL